MILFPCSSSQNFPSLPCLWFIVTLPTLLLSPVSFATFYLPMATPNPLDGSLPGSAPPASSKTFHIAGILTTVYGLEELPSACRSISCLWLLHPRLQTKIGMANIANTCIHDWNQRPSHAGKVGLIAVAFDQRNHGSREVTPLANQAWRSGNVTHAQDMFG